MLCAGGYVWLFLNYQTIEIENNSEIRLCIIKHVTTLPCPSCGSTRSIISLMKGDFFESVYWNPFGIILVIGLIITPLWIITDMVFRKETLLRFYAMVESKLRQKIFAIPAIVLVLLNWAWNIYKVL